MDVGVLQRQFAAIGAQVQVDVMSPRDWLGSQRRWRQTAASRFTIDVRQEGRKETFRFVVRQEAQQDLDLYAVDIQPRRRHLLLLAYDPWESAKDHKQKYLCGHDERHWFVAMVPGARGVTTVQAAMEALKPQPALISQRAHGVRHKNWHDRHNEGYIRQGEWFFVPCPDFQPEHSWLVLHNEPISRGGGTAHIVEVLCRSGGTTVYVNAQHHPEGLSEDDYRALVARNPEARKWGWRVMRRDAHVYAMGRVRHPDHKTIQLPFWHEVLLSAETRNDGSVVFLD